MGGSKVLMHFMEPECRFKAVASNRWLAMDVFKIMFCYTDILICLQSFPNAEGMSSISFISDSAV